MQHTLQPYQLYALAGIIYGTVAALIGAGFFLSSKTRLQTRLSFITLVTGIVCLAVGYYNLLAGN